MPVIAPDALNVGAHFVLSTELGQFVSLKRNGDRFGVGRDAGRGEGSGPSAVQYSVLTIDRGRVGDAPRPRAGFLGNRDNDDLAAAAVGGRNPHRRILARAINEVEREPVSRLERTIRGHNSCLVRVKEVMARRQFGGRRSLLGQGRGGEQTAGKKRGGGTTGKSCFHADPPVSGRRLLPSPLG